MENQIIPLLRNTKLTGELEKIKSWKEEGRTKEEILNLIDRRIVLPEDVEKIFEEQVVQINPETEESNEEEKNKEDVEEKNTFESAREEDEDENLDEEELEEILNEQNFYTENDTVNTEESKEQEKQEKEENQNEAIDEENVYDYDEEEEIEDFDYEEYLKHEEELYTIQEEKAEEVEAVDEEYKKTENDNQEEFRYLKDEELEDFPNQPFKLYDGEERDEMIQSIRINGIIQSLVVRPLENGKFQILAGHNRRVCGREAGLKEFPCIIKYGLSDDEAKLYLIDTNIATRKKISPMEMAKALLIKKNTYKSEQIKLKIKKAVLDENLDNINVREKMQEVENMSSGNLQRYLRLNHLEESLQNLVDEGKISLKVAENLSFIGKMQQKSLGKMIEDDNIKISESQSKKLKNEEFLNKDKILEILQKKPTTTEKEEIIVKFEKAEIERFFEDLDPINVKEKILNILLTLNEKY